MNCKKAILDLIKNVTNLNNSLPQINAELNGSIVKITDKDGNTSLIDLLSSTDELVFISVNSNVQGVNVGNLTINVYYNDSSTPSELITTDSNGFTTLSVPNSYKYRLVFPEILNCKKLDDFIGVATASLKSVIVTYTSQTFDVEAELTIQVLQEYQGAISDVLNLNITLIDLDNNSVVHLTDSGGYAKFDVKYGKTYTVLVPLRTGFTVRRSIYNKTVLISASKLGMVFIYYEGISGLFIIDSSGRDFPFIDWIDRVLQGLSLNSEASLIYIVNKALSDNGGEFAVKIDDLRERNYTKQVWDPNNNIYKSVTLNGNNPSDTYYYDGLTLSLLISSEAIEKGYTCPAVNTCLQLSLLIGGTNWNGFLGSIGQWTIFWNNRAEIDEILNYTRPNSQNTYVLSTFTDYKWTSTLYNAVFAWFWTSSTGTKGSSGWVVPFFGRAS